MARDDRRRIPRTDAVLGQDALAEPLERLGYDLVRSTVRQVLSRARAGALDPDAVVATVLAELPRAASGLTPVLNATGVIIHTNIGRAPLSAAAQQAVAEAAGYVDVELDLNTGVRAGRGRSTLAALREAVPAAAGALVVNNGAAALVLATTALAAGREVIVSRGELIEIGDGFRLPALIESTGARLREVGTTNRTHLRDYADAIGEQTGCILKVHPSNFRMDGFVADVGLAELSGLGVPVVMDLGSGLLRPEATLPDEPDAATALAQGATIVTASGDKLLGGPQAGLVLGDAAVVERLRRHPLARALRVDKLTLAALEATVRGPRPPVLEYLNAEPKASRNRAIRLADALGLGPADVVEVDGRVGGGGGAGVPLSGWAVVLPAELAPMLRLGRPAVLTRVEKGRCLLDLRCVAAHDEPELLAAVRVALASHGASEPGAGNG